MRETSKAAVAAATSEASIACLTDEVLLSGNIDSFWLDVCLAEFVDSDESRDDLVRRDQTQRSLRSISISTADIRSIPATTGAEAFTPSNT